LDFGERSSSVLFLSIALAIVLVIGLISIPKIESALSTGSTVIPSVIVVLPAHGNNTGLGLQLKTVGSTQNGRGVGPFNKSLGFTTIYDNGHLQLTVSTGSFQNGTMVIFSRLINIGQNKLTVGHLGIGGASSSGTELFDSYIIGGCTHNSTFVGPVVNGYSNGTVVTTSQTFTVDCNQPDFQGTTTFSTGETFSAYVLVSPSLMSRASSVGSGANYIPEGSNSTYSLQLNF
jgi:hypothetical protein